MKKIIFILSILLLSVSAFSQTSVPRYELVTATGTNTYFATISPTPSLQNGFKAMFKFTNGNTGASTFQLFGTAAMTLRKSDGTALVAGDIPDGSDWWVVYDGTASQWRLSGGSGSSTVDWDDITNTPTTLSGYGITDAQPLDSDLTTISSLTPTTDNFLQAKAGAWASRTIAQVKTDLGLTGTNSGDQTITLTGDITGSGTGSFATTLATKYILDQAIPSTSGATITLDMNSQIQRMHVGSASFAGPKTIAISNTTNSLVFSFTFTITDVAAVLTMPASFLMSDPSFDGTDWTPPLTGQYEMGGSFDGTNWLVKIAGPFN